MILVDTSVWIDHLRQGNDRLAALLAAETVACHPFVVGEIACGSLRNRREVLELLDRLPTAPAATHNEAIKFLEAHRLMGLGLGYIDIHLLAAAMLGGIAFWTLDKRLAQAAGRLGLSAGQ
ncbi:MAG: type II toxin-antitoxin system VapC family toxin [Gemmatimonadales bacterium]